MGQKIIITVLTALVALLFYTLHQDRQIRATEQQQLQHTLQALQQTMQQQEAALLAEKKQLLQQDAELQKKQQQLVSQARSQSDKLAQQLATSQQHSEQLEQRIQESAGQAGRMEQQLSELDEVVSELTEKQHQEARLRSEYEAMAAQALAASYRAKGLVYAQGIKIMVAEYYMMNGRYPRNNTLLGIQRPEAYANDAVRSITVSQGGRISIVYTEKAGQAGGAIHLTPREVNGHLEWRCSSWDFEDIRDTMPTCHYGG